MRLLWLTPPKVLVIEGSDQTFVALPSLLLFNNVLLLTFSRSRHVFAGIRGKLAPAIGDRDGG